MERQTNNRPTQAKPRLLQTVYVDYSIIHSSLRAYYVTSLQHSIPSTVLLTE